MNKLLKKAISLTMAAVIVVPVGMKTGAIKAFTGNTATAASANLLEVSNVEQTDFTDSTITISWQGDANADSYEVSYSDVFGENSDFVVAGFTTKTTYTISGLKSGCIYNIRVTPSNADGDNAIYGHCDNAKTKVSAMKGVKTNNYYSGAGNAIISWDKQQAADGYEYRWKNSNGKVIKKGTTKDLSLDFSVNNNNVYQFMVRAYQKLNAKTYYSSWKTIYVFRQPQVKSVAVKKNKKSVNQLKISWYKQQGATGYDVYVSKNNIRKNFKKVKSVGKKTTSVAINKFKGKKIKGTYYVYVISKVKTANGTSKSGSNYMWQTGFTYQGGL